MIFLLNKLHSKFSDGNIMTNGQVANMGLKQEASDVVANSSKLNRPADVPGCSCKYNYF